MEHYQNPSAPTNIAIRKSQENPDKRMQAHSVEFSMILTQESFHSVVFNASGTATATAAIYRYPESHMFS
jgi:hypothetical protein